MDEQTPYTPGADETPTNEKPVQQSIFTPVGEYTPAADKPVLLPYRLTDILDEVPFWNEIKTRTDKTTVIYQGTIDAALGDINTHWRRSTSAQFGSYDRGVVVISSKHRNRLITHDLGSIDTSYQGGPTPTEIPVSVSDRIFRAIEKVILPMKPQIPYRDIDAQITSDTTLIIIKYHPAGSKIVLFSNDSTLLPAQRLTIMKKHWESPTGTLSLPKKELKIREEHLRLLTYLQSVLPIPIWEETINQDFLVFDLPLDALKKYTIEFWDKNANTHKRRNFFEQWYLTCQADDVLVIQINNEPITINRQQIYEPSNALLFPGKKTQLLRDSIQTELGRAYSYYEVAELMKIAEQLVATDRKNLEKPSIHVFSDDPKLHVGTFGQFIKLSEPYVYGAE